MKRDLAYMIAVMQAAQNGREIQFYDSDQWNDFNVVEKPAWQWSSCDYRIKPEPRKPREWWLTPSTLIAHVGPTLNAVLVREVLPESDT